MSFIIPLLSGLFAAIFALIGELVVFSFVDISQNPFAMTLSQSDNIIFTNSGFGFLFVFALLEESFKYIVLRRTLPPQASSQAFFVFLFLFSIGFASLETALILINDSNLNTATFAHIATIALFHLATIFILGSSIRGTAYLMYSIFALPLATLVHFLYNIAVFNQNIRFEIGAVFLVIIIAIFSFYGSARAACASEAYDI